MKKLLKRTLVLGALAGIGYAVWKTFSNAAGGPPVVDLSSVEGPSKRREVTATGKVDGHITTLRGPWGSVTRDDAIAHIEAGEFEYYVAGASDYRLEVIASERQGKYLRTEPGGGLSNNLNQLPDA